MDMGTSDQGSNDCHLCLPTGSPMHRLLDQRKVKESGITDLMLSQCSSFLTRYQEFQQMLAHFHRVKERVADRLAEERMRAVDQREQLMQRVRQRSQLQQQLVRKEHQVQRMKMCQKGLAERAHELTKIADRLEEMRYL